IARQVDRRLPHVHQLEAARWRPGGVERTPAHRAARHDEPSGAPSRSADGLSQDERPDRAGHLRTVGRRSEILVIQNSEFRILNFYVLTHLPAFSLASWSRYAFSSF